MGTASVASREPQRTPLPRLAAPRPARSLPPLPRCLRRQQRLHGRRLPRLARGPHRRPGQSPPRPRDPRLPAPPLLGPAPVPTLRRVRRRRLATGPALAQDCFDALETEPDVWPRLRALYGRRPVLFALLHFGNWDVGGGAFTAGCGRSSVLIEPLGHPRLDDAIQRGRDRLGMTPLDVTAGLRPALRALHAGATIAVLVDRPCDRTSRALTSPFAAGPAACPPASPASPSPPTPASSPSPSTAAPAAAFAFAPSSTSTSPPRAAAAVTTMCAP